MVWGKVDDRLHAHPKVEAAGVPAMGLWVLALSHSCAVLTDGHVSRARAAALAGPDAAELAERLCAAGLWHGADEPCDDPDCDANRKPLDGWRFHAWADYQPTRESVEAGRKRKSDAGREGGYRKAASRKLAGASVLPEEAAQQNAGTLPGKVSAPVPVPVPVPVPSQKQQQHAREGEGDPESAAARVLGRLRSHPSLRPIALVKVAHRVADDLVARPKAWPLVEQAISDLASKAADAEALGAPWASDRMVSALHAFIARAQPKVDPPPRAPAYTPPEPVRTGTRLLTFDDPPRVPRPPPRPAPTTDATVPGDALALVAGIGLGGRS